MLAIPVACVSWTVTHEEILRGPREWCAQRALHGPRVIRGFFYVFTCEYCFSHYVALFFLILADFQMMRPGLAGRLIAWLSLVWIANFYIRAFGRLRLEIKAERVEIEADEQELAERKGTHSRRGVALKTHSPDGRPV